MGHQFIEYADQGQMMRAVAGLLAVELTDAIKALGRASIAVPGGSTPGPIFDVLSDVALDWSKVTVLPGDDRWVDETSEHSNAAQIKARLLQGAASLAQFQRLCMDGDGPDAVAPLTQELAPHLPITTALLGMGGDMHTASLFPGDAVLASGTSQVLHYVPVPGLDPRVPRMTLTPAALLAAGARHVLITGADKRAAFQAALANGDPVAAPILSVLDGARVHWAE